MPRPRDPVAHFWASIERHDPDCPCCGGCWHWRAGLKESGYGRMRIGKRDVKPHRFAYELLVGPIPDGLDLDHLCRNRACVNPAHLEPVTRAENLRRGREARGVATHCKYGHEKSVSANGFRYCKICNVQKKREFNDRRQARGLARV